MDHDTRQLAHLLAWLARTGYHFEVRYQGDENWRLSIWHPLWPPNNIFQPPSVEAWSFERWINGIGEFLGTVAAEYPKIY